MNRKCPKMCTDYWFSHPFSLYMLCPGCETWTDKEGKTWRRINLPSGVEIRPSDKEDGE